MIVAEAPKEGVYYHVAKMLTWAKKSDGLSILVVESLFLIEAKPDRLTYANKS